MNNNLFFSRDFTNESTLFNTISSIRRSLHRNPETGFNEWQTMLFLLGVLKDTKGTITFIPKETAQHIKHLMTGNGAAHVFSGTEITVPGFKLTFNLDPDNQKDKKHLAFRTDMDALPIAESSDPEHFPALQGFNSVNGAMHACGHDGHMAIAVTAALWVNANLKLLYQSDLSAISFIFQPAEEGCKGAFAILDAGFLDDIDLLYCYHLGMGLPSKYISPRPGRFLSSCKFSLEVLGKKSHAGHPELGVNALKVTASFIDKALNLLDVKKGLYVNISNLHCEGPCNVIPDHCTLDGEIRVIEEKELEHLYAKIENILETESKAVSGSSYKLQKKGVGLSIRQDEDLCLAVTAAAQASGLVIAADYNFNASEDASQLIRYLQKRGKKGCYFLIGSNIAAPHHNSSFDFDEQSLLYGFKIIRELILREIP